MLWMHLYRLVIHPLIVRIENLCHPRNRITYDSLIGRTANSSSSLLKIHYIGGQLFDKVKPILVFYPLTKTTFTF